MNPSIECIAEFKQFVCIKSECEFIGSGISLSDTLQSDVIKYLGRVVHLLLLLAVIEL